MTTPKPFRTVLIVEADPVQKDIIRLALSRLGWQVSVTADAGEARSLIAEEAPDLLILDTFLPGIHGLDLLRQMKTDRLLEATDVVVISAFGFQEIVRQAIQLGARDFLVKPLDVDLFLDRMKGLIGEEG
jgi:DNA-binding response OmpR family regulator